MLSKLPSSACNRPCWNPRPIASSEAGHPTHPTPPRLRPILCCESGVGPARVASPGGCGRSWGHRGPCYRKVLGQPQMNEGLEATAERTQVTMDIESREVMGQTSRTPVDTEMAIRQLWASRGRFQWSWARQCVGRVARGSANSRSASSTTPTSHGDGVELGVDS